jgi:hypothetical protein
MRAPDPWLKRLADQITPLREAVKAMGPAPALPFVNLNAKPEDRRRRAVVNGVLIYVGTSQIKAFISCQRLWYFEHVLGIPQRYTKALADGQQLHNENETFVTSGDANALGPLAREGSKWLPERAPELYKAGWLHPEALIEFPLGDKGVRFVSNIDLLDTRTPITVYDYKTTSKKVYALTPDKLKTDVQGVLYAAYGFTVAQAFGKPTDVIDLRWVYYLKGTKQTWPVDVKMPLAHTIVETERLANVVDEMHGLAAASHASGNATEYVERVGYNQGACKNYGGCRYAGVCSKSPQGMFAAELGETLSPSAPAGGQAIADFLSDQPVANATQPQSERGATSMGLLDKVQSQLAGGAQSTGGSAPPATPPPSTPPPAPLPAPLTVANTAAPAPGEPVPSTAPTFPERPPGNAAPPAPVAAPVGLTAPGEVPASALPPPPAPPAPPPVPEAPPAPPARRGRPPGSTNAKRGEVSVQVEGAPDAVARFFLALAVGSSAALNAETTETEETKE